MQAGAVLIVNLNVVKMTALARAVTALRQEIESKEAADEAAKAAAENDARNNEDNDDEDAAAVEAMLTAGSDPQLISKLMEELDCPEPAFLQVNIACVVVVPSILTASRRSLRRLVSGR